MKRFEQLEVRLPLAAQVIDLNPGFYGSQIEPVRLVDDWLYLEATVGEERRLMKTDGESFVDLGLGHNCLDSFVRGEEMVCVTEAGVDAFNFTTDTWSVLSDRPGGQVLNDETVMWFTQETTKLVIDPEDGGDDRWAILIDYVDLEGRTFHLEGESGYEGDLEFTPENVFGDAIIGVGDIELFESNSHRYIVRDGVATIAPLSNASLELAGTLLFDTPGGNYVDEQGAFVIAKPDKAFDFGTGAWLFYGDTLHRYESGTTTEILTTTDAEFQPTRCGLTYVTASGGLMSCDTELWGRERYSFDIATGMEFLGNVAFGPQDFTASPVGSYLGYELQKTTNGEFYLFDGDQFIPIAVDSANFVHMTDTHVLLKHYTEATGDELLQYELLPGDANLDGIFDSADLVHLFQLGEYEDDLVGNSSKATGDFDVDGEFGTSDLVLAFQQGTYEEN